MVFLLLWDISGADLSGIKTGDLQEDAKQTKDLAEVRNWGKTDIVTGKELEYGKSQMLEAFYEIEDVLFDVRVFRTLKETKRWLGT